MAVSPRPLDRLSQRTLVALDRALNRAVGSKGFRASGSGSRQARHARVARAMALAITACGIYAPDDDEMAAAFLSPELATLRPLSARVHGKFNYLVSRAPPTPAMLERSWTLGMDRLFELVPRLATLTRDEVLSVQAALCLMFIPAILQGSDWARHWKSAWSSARKRRLLDNPHIRMQLSIMGSYVGECGPHVAWLLDARSRNREMADAYCFVRDDVTTDLLEVNALNIRGEEVDPIRALYRPRPLSTVRRLLKYVRSCMREQMHFTNEGLVLMLLYYVRDVARHLDQLRAVCAPGEVGMVQTELQVVERVMVLEKARFWRAHDTLEDGPARTALVEFWNTRLRALDS